MAYRIHRSRSTRALALMLLAIVVALTTMPRAAAAERTLLSSTASPVGKILVDAKGRTVYLFASDSKGASSCSGACLKAWPAVIAPAKLPASLAGVTGKVGVLVRADGKRQLTINGLPLYTFSGDSGKGDVAGQGVEAFGAKWWVVGPNGKPISKSVPGSGSGSTPAPGGDGGPSYTY